MYCACITFEEITCKKCLAAWASNFIKLCLEKHQDVVVYIGVIILHVKIGMHVFHNVYDEKKCAHGGSKKSRLVVKNGFMAFSLVPQMTASLVIEWLEYWAVHHLEQW